MQIHRQLLEFGESQRAVTVCVPDVRETGEDFVLFCADGQTTAAFASEVHEHDAGQRSLWFVGILSCPVHRNAEYVFGRNESKFIRHEALVVHTVGTWLTDEAVIIRGAAEYAEKA